LSSSKPVLRFDVNGRKVEIAAAPHDVLLDVLRDGLGLIGTKRGCDQGSCGCCAVEIDGEPVLSCLTLAAFADGRKVATIEGLAGDKELHPLQEAFESCGATQCGYCTPGFIMTARGLLDRETPPDDACVKERLSGNLCRCTGYLQIVEAVRLAAEQTHRKAKPDDDRRDAPDEVPTRRETDSASR
jgi:aerobic carbon-monoxide dehydrogenase small subunit